MLVRGGLCRKVRQCTPARDEKWIYVFHRRVLDGDEKWRFDDQHRQRHRPWGWIP